MKRAWRITVRAAVLAVLLLAAVALWDTVLDHLKSDSARRIVNEEKWCAERRGDVLAYLSLQPQNFGEVGDWPAWHVAPYVSVWAVESIASAGDVGWWVICGDLPTDYESANCVRNPRQAVAAFAQRWQQLSERMEKGERDPDITIGSPEESTQLAPFLKARAELLCDWARDDAFWDDEGL